MAVRCPADAIQNDFDGDEYGQHSAVVPSSHTIEDALHPDYFGFVTRLDIRVHDHIIVRPKDASWYLMLLVRAVVSTSNQVHTHPIHKLEFGGNVDLPSGWTAEHDNLSGWVAVCLLYTSPSPRDQRGSRMPSSA